MGRKLVCRDLGEVQCELGCNGSFRVVRHVRTKIARGGSGGDDDQLIKALCRVARVDRCCDGPGKVALELAMWIGSALHGVPRMAFRVEAATRAVGPDLAAHR